MVALDGPLGDTNQPSRLAIIAPRQAVEDKSETERWGRGRRKTCCHLGQSNSKFQLHLFPEKLKREMDKLPAKPPLSSAAAVSGGSHWGCGDERYGLIPTPDAVGRLTTVPACSMIDLITSDRDRRTSRFVDGELINSLVTVTGTDPLWARAHVLWTHACLEKRQPTGNLQGNQAKPPTTKQLLGLSREMYGCLVINSDQIQPPLECLCH